MRRIPFPGVGWLCWLVAVLLATGQWCHAAEPAVPAKPPRHVHDQAGVLSAATRDALVQRLEAFERDSSSQVVVWTSPALPPGAALEDYVSQVFQAWKIGQAGRDNGVLLAIFVNDRRMRIEVGYGLEGALPDALCGRIIQNELAPRFRAGDYDGGISAAVAAILAATKGEYRGTGNQLRLPTRLRPLHLLVGVLGALVGAWVRAAGAGGVGRIFSGLFGAVVGGVGHPVALAAGQAGGVGPGLFVLMFVWMLLLPRVRGSTYDHYGRHRSWGGGWGGFSSGGGGGFGGFSGGGGRSGGGGASGGW